MTKLTKLLRDQKGAAALEYGLLAALISVAMMTAISDVGFELANTFRVIDAAMSGQDVIIIRR